MKKFVLATASYTLRLNKKHLNWLHANGYPDADELFCFDDRSNPALVACIEAVHDSMQPLVEQASAMLQNAKNLEMAAEADREKLSAAIDAFVNVVRACGVKGHDSHIIVSMWQARSKNMTWEEAYAHFKSCFGVTVEKAESAYEEYLVCQNSPAIFAMQEAYRKLEDFCEANSLRRNLHTIEIDDGYVVKTFDETRFTAKAVSVSDEEYERYNPSYWEKMELTPYLTRATVNSFMAKGDADGLMEYLRSLQSNLDIEV